MTKVVVIGNGMVGYKFCEKLRVSEAGSDFDVTVFGEEPWPAYDRVHLSAYFSGSTADDLIMAPVEWYKENKIDLRTNELVVKIDRDKKKVISHTGEEVSYDKLVLATGSGAFVPPIEGVEKKGVFVYRTLEDLDAIIDYGKKATSAAVIGGGLLGLEAAKAVMDMGLEAHVIEFAPRLMPRQLDDAGASILKSKLEDLGISIHLSKNTQLIQGDGEMTGLKFADDSELPVDMLVISAGIKPRDELAKDCGLPTAPRGGVIVNEFLQTEDEDIYAIGEVASYQNMIYGLVAPGYEMATQVVNQLVEEEVKPFLGFDMSTKLKLIGVDVGSFGDPFGEVEPSKPIVYENKNSGLYKRINVSLDGKRLLGGILVGDATEYSMLWQMAQNKMPLPPEPEDLILGARGGKESAGAGVESLPNEAQVCSCENVTKGDICSIIENDGVTKMDEIKSCTKAGTGCGGCVPMVNDLLKHQLKSMGKQVKNVICDHFDYSRQELLDIVKVKKIKSYDELLDQFGKGDGCEVCKPAVASILASTWNELITKQDTIQDTNDRYLANIQKGGTYSVVPRVPGGEITPDKLIVLGEVAKKYGLYSKITGGQRIDLFGARVDQLPDIWEELINAGFESGHAYGKSLRTIKSCVGSTWCRYGVQDSVSFAIQVEERYRGLRSPHKIKGAVSGCIRECAEAQSKDFGIIATEKGWNLYVCGNGGSKPQHAQLLINDVDTETCLKYIDRFLMFYIRTAEPLTRTATWLNKLEGGMDYLRDVVVNDSLGIGEELEKEMEFMIQTYACEWKEVVNNPELRAKFKHFVNSDEEDPNLDWQEMRGQKIPASWG
ncbi:nitrite reductase large subunit NirB [Echinicola jeungdonensis]|uniref:Nitrite reductase large subunit NirB n=1 Tax=Echinicola jeungdonensis TaxID=709343 RepID=A0ABV5J7S0_9BACT|nr:nitrite reductase large subunit NirB [Echinicola jeungdonensis]MDN3669658.1 nitrite reductase large subunit NirB [Echinicola jeungdonensis]